MEIQYKHNGDTSFCCLIGFHQASSIMPLLFLCVVPQGEFPCMDASCLLSNRCSRVRGIPVWSSVCMCLWDSHSHSEDCWDLPIKVGTPFTSENTHTHRQGDGLWYCCSVMVILAVLPDYRESVVADGVFLCLCSHLSFHWKQKIKNKKKKKSSMDARVTSPPDVCLSVGSPFSLMRTKDGA